jgi:alpha-beta hydrolase superfamily lysophospholipase
VTLGMRGHRLLFTVAVTVIWRVFVLRDRLLGRIGRAPRNDASDVLPLRYSIPSGSERLDSVFVGPGGPAKAALLICHGIGEIVDHWLLAQKLLASRGVASLVFDYAGYGKSTGAVHWSQCEQDAVSAFEFLKKLVPGLPVSILGFSMGSGISAAIFPRIDADRLILGSAFTSFREAACALGLPRALRTVVPPIWDGKEALAGCASRVLIMHCEQDRVFPMRMATELASWCGTTAEVVIVPDQKHNEPFYRPQWSYWEQVVSRLVASEGKEARSGSFARAQDDNG